MAAALVLGIASNDDTLSLLATLGISSLFLFAGLEVDLGGLRRGLAALLVHLAVRSLTLAAVAWAAVRGLDIPWQAAILVALALLTPSTGFILESLARLGLDEQERFWVTSKAIGGEMLALVVLFVVLQSGSLQTLALSTAAQLAMLFLLPLLFIGLMRFVVPYAAGSEFALLVMVGLVAAYVTKQLGVYYLVGASRRGPGGPPAAGEGAPAGLVGEPACSQALRLVLRALLLLLPRHERAGRRAAVEIAAPGIGTDRRRDAFAGRCRLGAAPLCRP